MKKNLTELVFILDRSGSMAGLESDTIGGYNAMLQKNREVEGEAKVSCVLFNHESKVVHDRVDIADVPAMTRNDYQVGGCTALLDAVGGAIKHIERVQRYMPDEYKAEHVVFVITTDGQENASRTYTYDQVKRTIQAKQEEGWEFLFLGADIDVAAEAGRLGIRGQNAVEYLKDPEGSAVMYDAVGSAVQSMRKCGSLQPDWSAPVAADTAKRKSHRWPFGRQ